MWIYMNDLTRLSVYILSLTEWDREIMGVVYDSLKLCLLRNLGVLNLSVLQAPDQDWVYSQRSPPVF